MSATNPRPLRTIVIVLQELASNISLIVTSISTCNCMDVRLTISREVGISPPIFFNENKIWLTSY